MAGAVNRRFALRVEPTPERLRQVGRITAAHLRYWGLDLQVVPVCRAVHELLRNVVAHVEGDQTCEVELCWSGRRLTVSVADRDRRLPRLLTATRGGLGRVARLSDSWGTCPTAEGKVIWFTRRVMDPQRVPAPGGDPSRFVPDAKPLPAASAETGAAPEEPSAVAEDAPVLAPAVHATATAVGLVREPARPAAVPTGIPAL
ncbi:ATP-binding protein [Streptomyces tsukubensis]|uniref:Histidine kinase/HSP90-like ATPase domain-containing protein n=1 Tax=Streptomyces tsukubensis TaxID=83656 RepID=A0A1V4AFT9_9ACTN|nr:ATP-binding protein [Streptomyces tsukubensis]OON82547.1 hypothetical protein B1H18_00190 [Streptomyces tsukubensis]